MRVSVALPLAALLGLAGSAAAQTRSLSVEQAIDIAIRQSPESQSARARARDGEDTAKGARGRLLPSIHASEEYQRFSEPFSIAFPLPGGPPTPFQIRDDAINTFALTARQPVLGLLPLGADYASARGQARAADASRRAVEAALREHIKDDFLRYFEAKAVEAIANASGAELEDQVKVAGARLRAGTITKADVLRIQVAAANAHEQEIAARGAAKVAKATLLADIGWGQDEDVEPAEPVSLLADASSALPGFGDAERAAEHARPELAVAQARAEAAASLKHARTWSLLPDVDAEAGYVRLDGQAFAPKNSYFVGARLEWNLWEWGTSFYAARAAAARAEAESDDLLAARRRTSADVAGALVACETAAAQVASAQQTIASAEEAYRVTDAQVRAGAATTTDLLAAQAALTQARMNLTRARYGQAMARVALERVTGQ
jgi:outer membrane protein